MTGELLATAGEGMQDAHLQVAGLAIEAATRMVDVPAVYNQVEGGPAALGAVVQGGSQTHGGATSGGNQGGGRPTGGGRPRG